MPTKSLKTTVEELVVTVDKLLDRVNNADASKVKREIDSIKKAIVDNVPKRHNYRSVEPFDMYDMNWIRSSVLARSGDNPSEFTYSLTCVTCNSSTHRTVTKNKIIHIKRGFMRSHLKCCPDIQFTRTVEIGHFPVTVAFGDSDDLLDQHGEYKSDAHRKLDESVSYHLDPFYACLSDEAVINHIICLDPEVVQEGQNV